MSAKRVKGRVEREVRRARSGVLGVWLGCCGGVCGGC